MFAQIFTDLLFPTTAFVFFSRGTQKTNREEAKGRTIDVCLNHQMLVDGKIAPSMRNRSVPEMFEAKQVPE